MRVRRLFLVWYSTKELMVKTAVTKPKQGRVIRKYRKEILATEFEEWQDLIRGKAKGRGLYALAVCTLFVIRQG